MGKERRKRLRDSGGVSVDAHAHAIVRSLSEMTATISGFDADHLADGLELEIRRSIIRIADLVKGQRPLELIEQARLRALPWHTGQPTYQAGIENGFTLVELIAIAAMKTEPSNASSVTPDEIVDECLEIAEKLRELASVRAVAGADPNDPLAWIGVSVQITEMSMRGSSYAELLEETTRDLFGDEAIDRNLRQATGFGVSEVMSILSGLHELQTRNMNRRQEGAFREYERVSWRRAVGLATEREMADAADRLEGALQPDETAASVSGSDIARLTQLPLETVEDVLDAFTWHAAADGDVEGALRAFLIGDNPLRATPVVQTSSQRAMLVHPALKQAAIRERLESAMRSTSAWEQYQSHRGRLLEERTRRAFERLLPSARTWHAFHYYVPANGAEEALGPNSYTKRVEGDHLIVVDDVAIVIEDKAVALSSQSRSATGFRLRKDLTGIITKAAEQADRLVKRIQADKGIRVHGVGWLDLQSVREIHAVAVSLEDLTSTSTATAELVQAGLIAVESVPWTVSIHDLDLIAELVAHPAEFLLYLRRRRHPEATVLYTAPDELDLFLYFFEAGLYVQENPDAVRSVFSFLPQASVSERERWREQTPGVITSRTDPLDAWYLEDYLPTRSGKAKRPSAAPKPQMSPSPLVALIEGVDRLCGYAAISIDATLLSGDTKAQRRMARYGGDVSRASAGGTIERTITVPIPTLADGGWILVWSTCPTGCDRGRWVASKLTYLRAKGHQIGVSRSALFAFDGATGEMFGVFYQAIPGELGQSELAILPRLQPASAMRSAEQVRMMMVGQRPQPRRRKKRR
ncbi:hypothetical protein [Agromyces sp. NPDC060279]|uniref:hypothetical protein n=1 Tax=Agromyces sp. NPDC060279 TaxID=3347092 RepID=UPI00366212DB